MELKKDGTPKKKPGRKKVEPVTTETKGSMVELPIDDIREISVTSRKRGTLANPEFDPFTKYKTDPNMYYRALNNRASNITKREAEGYKVIPEAKYGDLVLGCMPKEIRKERETYVAEKTLQQKKATSEQFKEDAAKGGLKTFEEK